MEPPPKLHARWPLSAEDQREREVHLAEARRLLEALPLPRPTGDLALRMAAFCAACDPAPQVTDVYSSLEGTQLYLNVEIDPAFAGCRLELEAALQQRVQAYPELTCYRVRVCDEDDQYDSEL